MRYETACSGEPLGVVAGITPFNFPVMVPMWIYPIALAAGNTVVLKPSELTPYSVLRLAELTADVLPPGVFNVVCGQGHVAEGRRAAEAARDVDVPLAVQGHVLGPRHPGAVELRGIASHDHRPPGADDSQRALLRGTDGACQRCSRRRRRGLHRRPRGSPRHGPAGARNPRLAGRDGPMTERMDYDGIGMTSARTRDRLVQRLRAEGIRDPRVLEALLQRPAAEAAYRERLEFECAHLMERDYR